MKQTAHLHVMLNLRTLLRYMYKWFEYMVDFPLLYFLLNWNRRYFTYWQGEEEFNKEVETQRQGCFT